MASIESLLNPAPELAQHSLPSPTLSSSTSTVDSRTPRQKRQKLAKDAPVFTRGKIRGELRYPPCEERDEDLTRLHREFQIHPLGSIADYPRHIPYNSDKKSFQDRTGRESFEVFQYTFKVPGEDKEWTVMWDYNIGLVRTTHLFKCNDYSKTTPAKMLNANPGLRDICHSITGGALAAQGYWMPFEAAKAVSATFCWKIRYTLTPLFGLDFPSLCIHPGDRALYGRMIIDPSVVRKATETANLYRMLELRRTPVSVSSDPPRSSPYAKHQILQHRKYATSANTGTGSMTPECADSFCGSPASSYRNAFTPVNTPRSGDVVVSSSHNILPQSPQEIPRSVSTPFDSEPEVERKINSADESDSEDSNSNSSLYSGPCSSSSSGESDSVSFNLDGDSDVSSANVPLSQPDTAKRSRQRPISQPRSHRECTRSVQFAREVKAAHALLSLYLQDAPTSELDECEYVQTPARTDGYGSAQGRKRRRASA